MENIVISRLQSVKFAEAQQYKNITILPLIATEGSFGYRSLSDALGTLDLIITEVCAGGSVPELLVSNRSKTPILLLDGEELAGAKQNRVLNTSNLLKELSQTRIPVSCTEQGRWSYASPSLGESGNVMAQKLRAMKSRDAELRRCTEIFRSLPGQVGLLAFTNNRPTGLDLISLSSAYASVHSKLVRSYALESLLESAGSDMPARNYAAMAGDFFNRVTTCMERRFPSVGCGSDFRYRGAALAGAALVHADEVIHLAFFQLDTPGQAHLRDMASLRNRRRFCRE